MSWTTHVQDWLQVVEWRIKNQMEMWATVQGTEFDLHFESNEVNHLLKLIIKESETFRVDPIIFRV